jgi:hypothetical protein
MSLRQSSLALVLLSSAGLLACTPTLDDLDGKRLEIRGAELFQQDDFHVFVRFDGCASFGDDLHGTIDGQPLTVVQRGGSHEEATGFYGSKTVCDPIELVGDRTTVAPGPAVVRVWDDSGEIVAEYPMLFGERSVELIAPADGQLFVGDEVTLRWSPDTDDVTEDWLSFDGGTGWYPEAAAYEGSTIRFRVPAGFDGIDEGPGELVVAPVVSPRPSRCEGADSCTAFVDIVAAARTSASFTNHARRASR